MKKLFLFLATVAIISTSSAQKKSNTLLKRSTPSSAAVQVAEGKFLIEANTGFGAANPADTGIRFSSVDGSSSYGFGAEGGYFFMDNLAVKVGLGYNGDSPKGGTATSAFSYKIGAKYYILSMIPVQIDYAGAKPNVGDGVSFLGLQAGYALFLGENVSVEPGIRYNMTLNKDTAPKDILQFNVGFALHF